ncbi:MAG: hypothetical protein LH465_01150 [Sphingomonas bacterium]|nr:hypothetical protein [Sphingomonas bacterium]
MTSGLPAFAALLLLVGGAPARTQSVDQASPASGVTTAPVDPAIVPPPPPKPRQLLLDMIKTLTQPRDPGMTPPPVPAEPAGTAVTPTPAPTFVTPVPPKPVAATPLPRPRAVPAVKVEPARPPRPTPPLVVAAPPPAPAVVAQVPRVIEPPAPVAPLPAPTIPMVAEQVEAVAVTTTTPRAAWWPWLLAGMIVALAAAFAAHRLRRHRRLERTRAALALAPRIDWSAGHGAPLRVEFARPPLAIRARLEAAHG